MFENLFTTKMSMDRKQLQKRFTKIRSKNGRISKVFSLIMAVVIATTMLYSTIVMAIMNEEETEKTNNDNKIQKTNISYLPQYIKKSVLSQADTDRIPLQKSEVYDKTNEGNPINNKTEKQSMNLPSVSISENTENITVNTDIPQTIPDEKIIKSSFVSDELYVGFEKIVLTDTNFTELEKELNNKGITQSQSTSIDLRKNYAVKDFTSDKTQVTADANGNISIYMSVDNDNLFDVCITDSETNEDVGQYSVLANNDNVYSFLGFEKGKNYNVEVRSKTQGDWNINGSYIIY